MSNQSTSEKTISLVPYPNHLEKLKTGYTASGLIKVSFPEIAFSTQPLINLLSEGLKQSCNLQIQPITENESQGDISFLYTKGTPPESYHLLIDKNGIKIVASDYNGFLYGVQTLLQLTDQTEKVSGGVHFHGIDIIDQPAFTWRGMHLDVCRHFFDVTFIKKMLDAMSMHKLNVFHWHLTDDQGWRIEIKKYPKLGSIAAWRNETVVGHMADYPTKFDGVRHGGYYTQDEIKDVVDYASRLGISIVPEIEMPGHAVAALTAYPEISCTGGPIKPMCEWGISDDVYCAGKEETFQFLENVLSEVIGLFPGEYIHIGGDECPKEQWKNCSLCQKRIKQENLKNENELQSYFINRIEKFLNSKGKKLIGWDEILEGGLAENAAVMSWRGEEGGIEAANLGHHVVMTPNQVCYLDKYQSDDYEPLTIGGITTMEEIYNWNIIPENLDSSKRNFILGAQANVWTEYMPNERQVEYMVFPRLCAISEILWTKKSNQNYIDFTKRMAFHYNRLDKRDIAYRIPYPNGIEKYNPLINTSEGIELSCEIPSVAIHYTVDGSFPDESSLVYNSPLKLNHKLPVTVKAVTIMPSGRKSVVVSGLFEKSEFCKPVTSDSFINGINFIRYDTIFSSAYNIGGIPDSSGILKGLTIPAGSREHFFGLNYSGFIGIPSDGIYTFSLDCDDGALFYINSHLVVDNDGFKYGGAKQGKIALEKGKHPFEIKYFQAKYGYYIGLSYRQNDGELVPVEPNQYFRMD